MTPFGRVALVALDSAMIGVDACELYVLAEIVSAIHAEEAIATRHTRFYCYSITYGGVRLYL